MATRRHAVAQRPATGALVHLYDVDISLHGGPVLHWTPGPMNSGGQNLVPNPGCLKNTTGWFGGGTTPPTTLARGAAYSAAYDLPVWGSGHATRASMPSGDVMDIAIRLSNYLFTSAPGMPAGRQVQAQIAVVPIRCRLQMYLLFYDSSNTLVAQIPSGTVENAGTPALDKANEVGDYTRLVAQGAVPAGADYAILLVRASPISGTATNPVMVWTRAQVAFVPDGTTAPFPFMPSSVVGPVRYGGVSYTPVPIEISDERTTGQGPIPRPRATIPNIASFASILLGSYRDLLRAKVSRRLVYDRFLDDGSEPDATDYYGPDVWYVDRVASHTPEAVTLELASPLDVQGKMLPARACIRSVCTHTYRTWNATTGTFIPGSCPYAGASYFQADGSPTGAPSLDDCGRRLSDCNARFPYPTPLPTRAFPGMVRGRI